MKREEPTTDSALPLHAGLNAEQLRVLTLVQKGCNVFFTGAAGTGKSFMVDELCKAIRQRPHHNTIGVTALTGVASIPIHGLTLHRWAGIGCESVLAKMEKKIRRYGKTATWRDTDVLIIDEVSMLEATLFENLDLVAQRLRKSTKPFGGMQLLLVGDFFQLPPVGNVALHPDQEAVPVRYCFESSLWQECNFEHILLKKIYRQKDPVFIDILRNVRFGILTDRDVEVFKRHTHPPVTIAGIQTTRLFPINVAANAVNRIELAKLRTQKMEYVASDGVAKSGIKPQKNPLRMLKHTQGLKNLELKVGAQVILVQNLGVTLVNGSRGVVVGFSAYVGPAAVPRSNGRARKWEKQFLVEFADTYRGTDGDPVYPVVKFAQGLSEHLLPTSFSVKNKLDGVIMRIQIPLKLAWALTIHKSQGLSIDRVDISMNRLFAKGHFYVALSRVRTLEGLSLQSFDPTKINADPKVLAFMLNHFPTMDVPRGVSTMHLEPPMKRQKRSDTFSYTLNADGDKVYPAQKVITDYFHT